MLDPSADVSGRDTERRLNNRQVALKMFQQWRCSPGETSLACSPQLCLITGTTPLSWHLTCDSTSAFMLGPARTKRIGVRSIVGWGGGRVVDKQSARYTSIGRRFASCNGLQTSCPALPGIERSSAVPISNQMGIYNTFKVQRRDLTIDALQLPRRGGGRLARRLLGTYRRQLSCVAEPATRQCPRRLTAGC